MLGNKRLQGNSHSSSSLFGLLPWQEVYLPLGQAWAIQKTNEMEEPSLSLAGDTSVGTEHGDGLW